MAKLNDYTSYILHFALAIGAALVMFSTNMNMFALIGYGVIMMVVVNKGINN